MPPSEPSTESKAGFRGRRRRAPWPVGIAILSSLSGFAAEEVDSGAFPEPSPHHEWGPLWEHAILRDDPSAPWLPFLAVTGRLHFDYARLESRTGEAEDWRVRRSRLGSRLGWSRNWEWKTEVDFDLNEASPLYLRLTDAYLKWTPSERVAIKIGKQATPFTFEGSTSSNQLLTLERSSFTASLWFPKSFIPGVTAEIRDGDWLFFAGLYSAGREAPEFGHFDGSVYGLIKVGLDLSAPLRCDEAALGLHYVCQDPDPLNTFTASHRQVVSANFHCRKGRWGWIADVAASEGAFEQPDLIGALVMPYFNLDARWQIVARAACVRGNGPDGVRLPIYEADLAGGSGDRSRECYLGLNRSFNGFRFKWQTGVHYAEMTDSADNGGAYAGGNVSSGVRISW